MIQVQIYIDSSEFSIFTESSITTISNIGTIIISGYLKSLGQNFRLWCGFAALFYCNNGVILILTNVKIVQFLVC
jgi:hypothetical protein